MKNSILGYYKNIEGDVNHRLKSWEHCYTQFTVMFKKDKLSDTDIDYLSLHLAFYLASWGMYRGSSFILQKDYKVFHPVIKLLFTNRGKFNDDIIESLFYDENDSTIKKYVNDFFEFDAELTKLLNEMRNAVKGEVVTSVSDTLRTKIILGAYGSIPAFDRYFRDGLRSAEEYGFILSYSKNGVVKLLQFAKERRQELQDIRKELEIKSGVKHTFMKVIDMCFWHKGYELEEDKKMRKTFNIKQP